MSAENTSYEACGTALETGAVLDAALSGNSCTIAIEVSVIAVREKCDEKGTPPRFSG